MRRILLTVLLLVPLCSYSQDTPNGLWDLSYDKVLNQNQIRWDHSVGTLFTWLADREDEHQYITNFVQKVLATQPEATFLLDHPTFPSAGRTTILAVKKGGSCHFYWRSTDEGMKEFKKRPLEVDKFEQITHRLQSMRQRGYENMGGPEKAYAGFLSVFKDGQSRQILLHINDFMEFDMENQQILRVGKIFEIENSLLVKNN